MKSLLLRYFRVYYDWCLFSEDVKGVIKEGGSVIDTQHSEACLKEHARHLPTPAAAVPAADSGHSAACRAAGASGTAPQTVRRRAETPPKGRSAPPSGDGGMQTHCRQPLTSGPASERTNPGSMRDTPKYNKTDSSTSRRKRPGCSKSPLCSCFRKSARTQKESQYVMCQRSKY